MWTPQLPWRRTCLWQRLDRSRWRWRWSAAAPATPTTPASTLEGNALHLDARH